MGTLRLLAATAVVLAALAGAASAKAPPKAPGFKVLFPRQVIHQVAVTQRTPDRRRSCSTGASRSRAHLPVVACEQPPRSYVKTVDGSSVFGSFHP